MTSVLIGYCHNGTVRAEFHECLIDLLIHESKRRALSNLERTNAGGPYIADNRNRIAQYFVERTESEWLLFLDNDMVFNPNLLELLLAAADNAHRKILAGCYVTLGEGEIPVVAWLKRRDDGKLYTVGEFDPKAIVPLDLAGMGGTLIHRDVFINVRSYRSHLRDNWIWFGHDLDNGEHLGEDGTFCLRAAECGYQTFGVGGVQMVHMKTRKLGLDALKDKAPPKST